MNVGVANVCLYPSELPWNNQSDQRAASVQEPYVSKLRPSFRPGAQTPGGVGVDVKNGSYHRYLNKLKNKNGGCGKKR